MNACQADEGWFRLSYSHLRVRPQDPLSLRISLPSWGKPPQTPGLGWGGGYAGAQEGSYEDPSAANPGGLGETPGKARVPSQQAKRARMKRIRTL